MINVVDEVLSGEETFNIVPTTDSFGNTVYKISLATSVTTPGTPLNKALFDQIDSFLCPPGLICMWSGSTVPTGWYLCDGQNGTPDLRNRFIVGAGNDYDIGDTGGEKEHILTIDEIPSHTHSYSHHPSAERTAGATSQDKYSVSPLETYTTGSTGGGQAHENRPPYYALAYIMKG